MVAAALVAACTVSNTEAPPLAGPSELGLSLSVQASPDVLVQNGEAQAEVVVVARDAMSQPVRNLALRVEIQYRSNIVDYGQIAPGHNIVTGGDGKAVVTYTPPAAPPQSTDTGNNIVTLLFTPVGTDYASAVPRQVQIRLVPPGIIAPPVGPLFTFSPSSPVVNQVVYFDAGLSTVPEGRTIVVYEWDFGDGKRKRIQDSATTHHYFLAAGDSTVVLTTTDSAGHQMSVSRTVKVSM
jgi:hypothetical protein